MFFPASKLPRLVISATRRLTNREPRLYFKTWDDNRFSEAKALNFDSPDGACHLIASTCASPKYRGIITGLRLDPAAGRAPGEISRP